MPPAKMTTRRPSASITRPTVGRAAIAGAELLQVPRQMQVEVEGEALQKVGGGGEKKGRRQQPLAASGRASALSARVASLVVGLRHALVSSGARHCAYPSARRRSRCAASMAILGGVAASASS